MLYKICHPLETRKGSLIQSGDSRCYQTKWEFDGNYTCINGNKFEVIEEFISSDNGQTWRKTGNIRLGNMVEADSQWCSEEVIYKWELNTDKWQCEE